LLLLTLTDVAANLPVEVDQFPIYRLNGALACELHSPF
jgi:hypothetical protein